MSKELEEMILEADEGLNEFLEIEKDYLKKLQLFKESHKDGFKILKTFYFLEIVEKENLTTEQKNKLGMKSREIYDGTLNRLNYKIDLVERNIHILENGLKNNL